MTKKRLKYKCTTGRLKYHNEITNKQNHWLVTFDCDTDNIMWNIYTRAHALVEIFHMILSGSKS